MGGRPRHRLAGLALLLACGLAVPPAEAGPTYVIGVENVSYLPFYGEENGAYGGYARVILDAFAKDRHYDFEYRPLPVPRLYASFFADQVDFKFPDNPDWQPELRKGKPVAYSDAVLGYVDGANVIAGEKLPSLADIRSLGTVTGFSPWPWLPLITSGKVTLTENASFKALVQQVLSRRIDAAYANVAVISRELEGLHQPGALVFDPDLPHDRGTYFLSTLKQRAILAEFSGWLRANRGFIVGLTAGRGISKETAK